MNGFRSSKRIPKPTRHADYVPISLDRDSDEEEENYEDDREESSLDLDDLPSSSAIPAQKRGVGRPMVYARPNLEHLRHQPSNNTRKSIEYFTSAESLAIFQFILSQIRSTNPAREGRVAKRRVELSSLDIWEKCKEYVGAEREVQSYRTHFNHYARKLHEYSGITLMDKVDLYYALDIRVDKSMREKLIRTYEVQFDEAGIITGSLLLHHWDLVHSDSEGSDDDVETDSDGNKRMSRRNCTRFTEYDDGIMWQFIVDDINDGTIRELFAKKCWEEFRNIHCRGGGRAAETYRGRYIRILLPNLHKMPFDIETKAALYFHLENAVPEEFRKELIEETQVELDEEGIITKYTNCPQHLVLQSRPYNSVIGITSTNRLSTLKHPSRTSGQIPYTQAEDDLIWEYILKRSRVNNRNQRIKEKMSGWMFWKQFMNEVGTNRTWQSLSEHFVEDLMENIMDLPYSLHTRMELYYALARPVEDDVLAEFETIANVVLNKGGAIRLAFGEHFTLGKKEKKQEDGDDDEDEMDVKPDISQLTNRNILSFMEQVEREAKETVEAQQAAFEMLPNSEKYPYMTHRPKPRGRYRKRNKNGAEPAPIKQSSPSSSTSHEEFEVKLEDLQSISAAAPIQSVQGLKPCLPTRPVDPVPSKHEIKLEDLDAVIEEKKPETLLIGDLVPLAPCPAITVPTGAAKRKQVFMDAETLVPVDRIYPDRGLGIQIRRHISIPHKNIYQRGPKGSRGDKDNQPTIVSRAAPPRRSVVAERPAQVAIAPRISLIQKKPVLESSNLDREALMAPRIAAIPTEKPLEEVPGRELKTEPLDYEYDDMSTVQTSNLASILGELKSKPDKGSETIPHVPLADTLGEKLARSEDQSVPHPSSNHTLQKVIRYKTVNGIRIKQVVLVSKPIPSPVVTLPKVSIRSVFPKNSTHVMNNRPPPYLKILPHIAASSETSAALNYERKIPTTPPPYVPRISTPNPKDATQSEYKRAQVCGMKMEGSPPAKKPKIRCSPPPPYHSMKPADPTVGKYREEIKLPIASKAEAQLDLLIQKEIEKNRTVSKEKAMKQEKERLQKLENSLKQSSTSSESTSIAPKPSAVILAMELFTEQPSIQTEPDLQQNVNPRTHADPVIDEIIEELEDHLKTFSREFSDANTHLASGQRDMYSMKMAEIVKLFKHGIKEALKQ